MELAKLLGPRRTIRIAIAGTGVMGEAICRRISRTPNMEVVALITQSPDRAQEVVNRIDRYFGQEVPYYQDASAPEIIRYTEKDISFLCPEKVDVFIDATGNVARGFHMASLALKRGVRTLSFSAECDALTGPTLATKRTSYGFADGDQPGSLMRVHDECKAMGLEVVGLMNCKGFLNRYAVPEDMRRFQDNACGSSLGMITSFTDGTKMALEMNTVANATGFGPLRSGMVGFHNTSVRGCGDDLSQILPALLKGFSPPGFVDYTLGGDFGAGVFAVVKDKDPYESRFLDYFKMGKGPFRAVHRPYHLCQFEVSRSVAEIYLYDQVPCVPLGTFAKTSAVAKRDLMVGDRLEGIGGSDLYGILENTKDSKELVHISLCRGATVLKDYKKDEKIKRADLGLSRDMSELESLLL